MPSYVVTLKTDATDSDLAAAKKLAVEQGGTIGHEYTLIKGFSVSFPENTVMTLAESPYVESVDADQVVGIN